MPSRGVADAVAEAEHRERLARGLDDLGALVAADPLGHHDLLGVDVLEAVALHLGDRPLRSRDRAAASR